MSQPGDVESTIRTTLEQVSAASPAASDLAERLLVNARAGRRQVVTLRPGGRSRRWVTPLLAAAAVAAVAVGTAAATHAFADHRTPAGGPSGTGAPAPSSAANSSTPNRRNAPPPTKPDSPVPAGFHAAGSYFLDTDHGWVIGTGKCPASRHTDCPALIRTTDGGRSWTRVHAPTGLVSPFESGSCISNGQEVGHCVDKTVFADAGHGYLYSLHDLYWTSDGGRHWSHEAHPLSSWSGAQTLVIAGTRALRLRPLHECSSGCAGVLQSSPIGSDRWLNTNPPGKPPGAYSSSLRARAGTVYFLSGATYAAANGGLYRSSDGGSSWSAAAYPCGHPRNSVQDLDAGFDGSLAVACGSRLRVAAAGSAAFSGQRPLPRDAQLEAALSGRRLLATRWNGSGTALLIFRSDDGGRHWHAPVRVSTAGELQFVSASDGYALSTDGSELLHTSDGGATWQPSAFS